MFLLTYLVTYLLDVDQQNSISIISISGSYASHPVLFYASDYRVVCRPSHGFPPLPSPRLPV